MEIMVTDFLGCQAVPYGALLLALKHYVALNSLSEALAAALQPCDAYATSRGYRPSANIERAHILAKLSLRPGA
jgi:hypothetical protein